MHRLDMQRSAPVYIEDELESTSSKLKTLETESGTVLIARRQSGGRGRQGRSFESPEGGIYLSYLLRPDCQAQECSGLSALTALAVRDAVLEFAGIKADIKWPNDLLLNEKKLCGILTELSFDKRGEPVAVIGIGLNLNTPADDFPPQLKDIACSLYSETGRQIDTDIAARCLIKRLDGAFEQWAADRSFFLQRYREFNICRNRDVLVISGAGSRKARALDINDDLSLRVQYENGQQEDLYSGEISIRVK